MNRFPFYYYNKFLENIVCRGTANILFIQGYNFILQYIVTYKMQVVEEIININECNVNVLVKLLFVKERFSEILFTKFVSKYLKVV